MNWTFIRIVMTGYGYGWYATALIWLLWALVEPTGDLHPWVLWGQVGAIIGAVGGWFYWINYR